MKKPIHTSSNIASSEPKLHIRTFTKQLAVSALALSLLSVSIGSTTFAASFNDLQGVNGKDKINALASQQIINGMSETTFAPAKSLTQAQALHMIVKAFKLDIAKPYAPLMEGDTEGTQQTIPSFTHVKPTAWYAAAFNTAAQAGLDIPATTDPDAVITREQYVNYVMNAMQLTGNMPVFRIIPPDIKDESAFDVSLLGSAQLAIVLHIANLDADGNFNPKQKMNRADSAIILYDAMNYLNERTANAPSPEATTDPIPPGKELPPIEDAPSDGQYVVTDNGTVSLMQDIQQAMTQYASTKDTVYFVAIDLSKSGSPVQPDSPEAATELKRLQNLGYDVAMNTGWTYKGMNEKVDYPYLSGYFTAEQLNTLKVSDAYGYTVHFAYNGDGSPATAKNGAVNHYKMDQNGTA